MKMLNRIFRRKMTKMAVQVAHHYDVKLDFSNESIEDVDKVLGLIRKDYLKTKSMDGMNGLAMEFGMYIITTIEKNFKKGRLEFGHPDFGDKTFPYYWEGTTLFPTNWCLKRILDGKADDVWSKYQVLVIKKGK